jgi:hypothetical protein
VTAQATAERPCASGHLDVRNAWSRPVSRAYCLTCNEQVHETLAGTCPLGHPVTAAGHGPEPWVGFAGNGEAPRAATTRVEEYPEPRQLERLDAAGRPVVHAGSRSTNGHANGHANGQGVALGGGHGSSDPFPSTFGHRSSFAVGDDAPARPTERAPANSQATDDLAALLAEALREGEPTPPADGGVDVVEDRWTPSAQEPVETPVATDADVLDLRDGTEVDAGPAWGQDDPVADWDAPVADWDDPVPTEPEQDWDELASLAAELRLEEGPRDDGPVSPMDRADTLTTTGLDVPPLDLRPPYEPPALPEAAAPDVPGMAAPDVPDVAAPVAPVDDPPDLEALLAELGGAQDDAPVEMATDPFPAPAEPTPAEALPPPPPPAGFDPLPPPPFEPVPFPAPDVAEATAWDPHVGAERAEPPADAPVDLTNFTASGRRVSAFGARSARRKRGFRKKG